MLKLYEHPRYGFIGKKAFVEKLDRDRWDYDKKDVDKLFLREEQALHRNAPKHFPRRRYYVNFIDEVWNADLFFLNKELAKANNNISVYLSVIDAFSKYAWVIPLKNKESKTVVDAFKKIFKERKPLRLQTDQGSEFKGATIAFLEKQGIDHYFSYSELKVPIVERFNRSIKNRVNKYQKINKTLRFIDVLPGIVEGYNTSYHSSIKMTPRQASLKKNEDQVYKNLFPERKATPKAVFKVGDRVRLSVTKKLFDKETVEKWTREVFEVSEIRHSPEVVTYGVKDLKGEEIKGSFYKEQLQRTEVKE